MKICQFDDHKLGVVREDGVHDVTEALEILPVQHYPFPRGDLLIANLDALRGRMDALADKAPAIAVDKVRFLSPVANPTKIIGTPTNYHAHVEEALQDKEISKYSGGKRRSIDEQGLFLKACSALVGPSEGVEVRFPDRRTDHEGELGVIIGTKGSDIAEADVFDYIAGYSIALDMVVRGSEDRSFRKSIDSYAVLGPWLVTKDEIDDPDSLDFNLSVNGELRQKSNTSKMIIDIARQVSWASTFYTLYPGDIIMTGTCEGVSQVNPGDVMRVEFEGVGVMEVPIRAHG